MPAGTPFAFRRTPSSPIYEARPQARAFSLRADIGTQPLFTFASRCRPGAAASRTANTRAPRTATRRTPAGSDAGDQPPEEHPMSRTRRGTSAALAALALTLAVPSMAAAATKPGVSTGGASKVTITTATLNGKVDPHGAATTYFFQYGTTAAYGSRTPDAGAGAGTAAVGATARRN